MNTETRTCRSCKDQFTIGAEDFARYGDFKVDAPRMCPGCRARLRLSFRNERAFYKRPCDKCKKEVVSMYSPNKPDTVWCYDCWFSDGWDAAEYAQDYDPEKPFLEQVKELHSRVPKVGLIYVRSVNSEYVNISADNKDCYMLVESSNNEGCIHSYWIQQCKDSVDLSFSHQTQLSYESDDCYNCYGLKYSKGCYECRDSYFMLDSTDCENCIGCVNLKQKKYCVFNEQKTKEEYESFLRSSRLDTHEGVEALRKKFEDFARLQIRKYAEARSAPGSTGNYMADVKNCRECFHAYDAEDCAYAEHVWREAKDCMDVSTAGRNANRIYNSINTGIDVANNTCCVLAWSSTYLEYSFNCFNSNNCLGSAGLRKKEYCILNKQYSKEEFEALRKRIIEELRKEGVWGEFFPADFSSFGYNETAAQDAYPLTKPEALRFGFKWEDAPRGTYKKETIEWNELPDSIQITERVAKEIFKCIKCEKNYRVIPPELLFYKRLTIPIPRLCPDCRHTRRFEARGPNKLWRRKCMCEGANSKGNLYKNTASHVHSKIACPNEFETSYAPERPEIVYCEQCYNAEVS